MKVIHSAAIAATGIIKAYLLYMSGTTGCCSGMYMYSRFLCSGILQLLQLFTLKEILLTLIPTLKLLILIFVPYCNKFVTKIVQRVSLTV